MLLIVSKKRLQFMFAPSCINNDFQLISNSFLLNSILFSLFFLLMVILCFSLRFSKIVRFRYTGRWSLKGK